MSTFLVLSQIWSLLSDLSITVDVLKFFCCFYPPACLRGGLMNVFWLRQRSLSPAHDEFTLTYMRHDETLTDVCKHSQMKPNLHLYSFIVRFVCWQWRVSRIRRRGRRWLTEELIWEDEVELFITPSVRLLLLHPSLRTERESSHHRTYKWRMFSHRHSSTWMWFIFSSHMTKFSCVPHTQSSVSGRVLRRRDLRESLCFSLQF